MLLEKVADERKERRPGGGIDLVKKTKKKSCNTIQGKKGK